MNWEKLLSNQRLRESTKTPHECDKRNGFESDLGRIVFSPAVRRMHDKTQVFPLVTNDNIHTRLTHSMEVQTIAYSIGLNICFNDEFLSKTNLNSNEILRQIPIILSSISLCHDIGNPPFGHFGEEIIQNFFKEYFEHVDDDFGLTEEEKLDFIRYNGNAQGFRVLTKQQILQDSYGLNLTSGTLAAFLKYPNTSNEIIKYEKENSQGIKNYRNKLGVFKTEISHLNDTRSYTGLEVGIRHPLAFLMEAADSICYLIMDIEDGYNSNYYTIYEIVKCIENNINSEEKEEFKAIHKIFDDIKKEGINVNATKMVKLRLFIMNMLIDTVCKSFIKNYESIMNGTFTAELLLSENNSIAERLQIITREKILNNRKIQMLELTGESVLKGLLKIFSDEFVKNRGTSGGLSKKGEKLLNQISGSLKVLQKLETGKEFQEQNNYYKFRIIVDYISGMTDSFALDFYRKINGVKIG